MLHFSCGLLCTLADDSMPSEWVAVAWRNCALGCWNLTRTVSGSTAVVLSTPLRYPWASVPRAPSFGTASKLSLTTCAVSGVPSLKVTPDLRWNVNVVVSELMSQLFASHGTILPVLGSWSVRESTT